MTERIDASVGSSYYSYVVQPGYVWGQRISTVVSELLLLLITVTYIIRYRQYLRTMKASYRHVSLPPMELQIRKWRVATHAFTILTICLHCLHGLHSALNAWSIYAVLVSDLSCTDYYRSIALLYHWSKFSLYTVMALRIKVVFHDSAFHDPINRILYAMYALLLIFLLAATVYDVFAVPSINIAIRASSTSGYCLVGDADAWSIAVFVLADAILSLLCLVLFNIPLQTLVKSCGMEDDEILDLTRKYTILTCTAIASTAVFSVLSVVLRMAWLMNIDTIVNALCLLFMSSFYAHYYTILCPCCVGAGQRKARKKTMMVRDDKKDCGPGHAFRNKAAQWTASAFGSGFSEENPQLAPGASRSLPFSPEPQKLVPLSPPMQATSNWHVHASDAAGGELDTVPEMMMPAAHHNELKNRLESVDDVVEHLRGQRSSQSMRSQKHSQTARKATDEISMTGSRKGTREYSMTKSRTVVSATRSAMAALRSMDHDEKRQSAVHVLHNLRDHLHMGNTGTLKAIVVTQNDTGFEPSEHISSKQVPLALELNVTKENQDLIMMTGHRTETHSITAVDDDRDSDDDEHENAGTHRRTPREKYSDADSAADNAYGNRLSVLDAQENRNTSISNRKSVSLSVSHDESVKL